jgi:integrase/recombinase XerD
MTDDLEIIDVDPVPATPQQVRADTDDELVGVWLRTKRSEHTRDAYRRDVDSARDYIGRPLRTWTLEDLQDWLDHLDASDYAPATVRRRLNSVKSLIAFAYRVGYVPFDVGKAIQPPADHQNLGEKVLTKVEIERIFAAAGPTSRDGLMLRLLYVTGMRREELVRVQWSHFYEHEQGATLRVVGKGDKPRTVDVPAKLWVELDLLRGESEYVFASRQGGHLTPTRIYQIVRAHARGAGIDRGVTPHWFRHSTATHALNAGAPVHLVQKKLGHASLNTTTGYADLLPGDSLADYLEV